MIFYKKKDSELISADVLVGQKSFKERFKSQLAETLRNLFNSKF